MNPTQRISRHFAMLAVAALLFPACNDDPSTLGTGGSGGSGGTTSSNASSSDSSSSMSSSSTGGNGGDGGMGDGGMGGDGGAGGDGTGGGGGAGGGLPQCAMVGEWVCVADVNDDGVITVSDLTQVLAQFNCPVGTGDADCDAADITRDGVVDTSDSDIANALNSHVTCEGMPPKPDYWMSAADVNGDGVVNTTDLLAVNASFGCTDASLTCLAADVTRDGLVTATDTDVLQAVWNFECQL